MEIIDNFLQDKYKRKRTIIIAIYSAIFLVFVLFVYSVIKSDPTCFDGKQNQNEQGVDCGGVCAEKCEKINAKDLIIDESGFIESGIFGKYDIYAKIKNPNSLFGSGEVLYEFKLKDQAGNILVSKTGKSFILPAESKYIIENNIPSSNESFIVEFSIISIQWTELTGQYEKPKVNVVNRTYNEIASGVGFSEFKALFKNESPFDFNVVNIKVILKDENNKIVALNSTEIRTVKSGENREIITAWPNRFLGSVVKTEVQSDINVFSSEAFAKKYFTEEKFQQYQN